MERPALTRRLPDIGAGMIEAVVVYEASRLTRSLAGFARFNATSSMGRLTLKVLLSFAQRGCFNSIICFYEVMARSQCPRSNR